jgi:hypothetical protein
VDNKEFRNLLLLLKEDLEENNIPHRTTMTKRILDLHAEQNEHLSNQMLVSLFNLFVLHLFYFILFYSRRAPWEKSLLLWTFGQTPI